VGVLNYRMKVLITGGSGLIGQELTRQLLDKGIEVSHLGRSLPHKQAVPTYLWGDLDTNKSILNVDALVHLAGANVGEKRWSSKRKSLILNSRIDSAKSLYRVCSEIDNPPKVIVSASGISCYPSGLDTFSNEDDSLATGFLADVVHDWELSADRFSKLGMRVVKLRTGLVLSDKGGVLDKMALIVKLGLASPLGSGKQSMPWVHVQDMAKSYVFALENKKVKGVYNVVADEKGVSNELFTKCLATVFKRPMLLPNVPGFVLRLIMGEMADLALVGNKVSNKKIKEAGFEFEFSDLNVALKNLYA